MKTPLRFSLLCAALFALALPGWAVVTAQPDDGERAESPSENAPASDEEAHEGNAVRLALLKKKIAALQPQTGMVILKDGLASVNVPEGLCYLSPRDAKTVLVDLWGNPPARGEGTLGMLMALGEKGVAVGGWGIVISFTEDGYVDDADAAKIDYAAILRQMKKSTEEANKERVREGYESIRLVGWAEPPHYDAAAHKIYWAKELAFGESDENTLNYCVRILGRRGVLELNAVAEMGELPAIREQARALLPQVEFNAGHRYADYNASTDKLATYGLAALVAGGVAGKMGVFKMLLAALIAGKKFVILGVIALAAGLKRLLVRKPKDVATLGDDTRE